MTEADRMDEQPIARVDAQPERVVTAAAFRACYPLILNRELIPTEFLIGMEKAWRQRDFAERSIQFFHLRDVYLAGPGFVFDQDLRLIDNASPFEDEFNIVPALNVLREWLSDGPHSAETRPSVVAKRPGEHNYGHFLLEMLPLAVMGKEVLSDIDPDYLVTEVHPPLQDAMYRALRLADIPLRRVRMLGWREPRRFADLWCIQGVTQHGQYMAAEAVRIAASAGRNVAPGPARKIFVRRTGDQSGQRPLLNQPEIEARLAKAGFAVVETNGMTVEQQIAIFKGATLVVGVTGAAMTNIAFCQPGTPVVSLVPASFPDTFFWFIATHRQLPFMEIRGDQAVHHVAESWKAGFSLRDEDIRFLEKMTEVTVPALHRRHDAQAGRGDVPAFGDTVLGFAGTGLWIEGVTLYAPDGLGAADLAFQMKLWDGETSDWANAGTFLGSRGLGRPTFGFRLRLDEDVAQRFACLYWGTFTDGTRGKPCAPKEWCEAESGAPLESLRVRFIPLTAGAFDEPSPNR